ncbi:hypothetical protein ACLOJK_035791 [Asimina triloba]
MAKSQLLIIDSLGKVASTKQYHMLSNLHPWTKNYNSSNLLKSGDVDDYWAILSVSHVYDGTDGRKKTTDESQTCDGFNVLYNCMHFLESHSSVLLEMELQGTRTAYLNPSRPPFSPPCIPISLSNPFFSKNSQSALGLCISRHPARIPKPLSVSAARRPPSISKKASAVASAAAPAEKEDRLPAELNITEIEELNSRVCDSSPFLSVSVLDLIFCTCFAAPLM